MPADQFPLGNSSQNRTQSGGGIDANVAAPEEDINYKPSRFGRLWLYTYAGRKWWDKQRTWVKVVTYALPFAILLLLVILLGICLNMALKRNRHSTISVSPMLDNKTATTKCDSVDCIRTAGRILATMNLTADPCVDFYDYACGGFSRLEEIAIGKQTTTQFSKKEALVLKQLKALVRRPLHLLKPSDRIAKKINDFYTSCLNTIRVEVRGKRRLQQMVADLGGFWFDDKLPPDVDKWSFEDSVLRRSRYTMDGIFKIDVTPDIFNTSRSVITLDRGHLGLGPDTGFFYVNKSLQNDSVMVAYTKMLQSYAQLIVGKPVDVLAIQAVVKFEQELAAIQSSLVDRQNVTKIYQEVKISGLNKVAPYISWDRMLGALFSGVGSNATIDTDTPVVVLDAGYFRKLKNVTDAYKKTPEGLKAMHNYIVLLAVSAYAPRLGREFRAAYARFATVYSGNRGQPKPAVDCLGDTNEKLGFALGKLYLQKYSSYDHKNKAILLIKDIYSSYRSLIDGAKWMDAKTKENALEKLDSMKYDVAFPSKLLDDDFVEQNYVNFTVTSDYVANLFEYYNHSIRVTLKKYGKTPEKIRWPITPQTVNGIYDIEQNAIFVASALLQEPFFYTSAGIPDAMTYGSMGALIGHEMTHAFDLRGNAFDKAGNMKKWWSKDTYRKFVNHTSCFIRQFDSYTIDRRRIDGRQTLNENLADSSGLKSAFAAYKEAKEAGRTADTNARLPGLSLTPEQLFHLSYAQTYCTVLTKQALNNQVLLSPTSPSAVRVIGTLASSQDFARIFNCKVNTKVHRKEKCFLW